MMYLSGTAEVPRALSQYVGEIILGGETSKVESPDKARYITSIILKTRYVYEGGNTKILAPNSEREKE